MSTHERDEMMRTPVPPATVSRRGALGRLLGLGAGAAAAVALPAVAQPAAEPATILPNWLQGQPDWLVANVERYARSLATLTDPLAPWLEGGRRSREGQVLRTSEFMVAGMNVPDDEVDARHAETEAKVAAERAAREARTPVVVEAERLATAKIGKLDRNQRRRVHRWIARQPKGPDHPIIRLRPAGLVGERRRWDLIDVAQGQRHHWEETPFSLLERVMADIHRVIGPRSYVMSCCHFDQRDAAFMFALPDGTLVETVADWRRVREMA